MTAGKDVFNPRSFDVAMAAAIDCVRGEGCVDVEGCSERGRCQHLPPRVDTTGTLARENPIRDVMEEFPFAMYAVAAITSFGAGKHRPRSWRDKDYVGGHNAKLAYFTGKMGRHIIRREVEGDINHEDGGNLHSAAVAWNALAYLDTVLRAESNRAGITDPGKLLRHLKEEGSECS